LSTLYRLLAVTGVLLLAACGRAPVLPPAAGAEQVELGAVPFFPQRDYQCGPAALATVFGHLGHAVDPDALVDEVYLPGKRGSLQVELKAAARRRGLVPYPLPPELEVLLATLRSGHPVLVLQDLGTRGWPQWHFAVVVGFDGAADTFLLRSGTTRRQALTARKFLATWERAERWGLVVLPPGTLPPRAERDRYLRAVTDMEGIAPPAALVAAFGVAVERWPDSPWARAGLGNAHYAAGDRAAAEAQFAALLRRQPESVLARNNLAQLLGERGCRTAALALLDEGLANHPGDDRERAWLQATRDEVAAMRAGAEGCPPPPARAKSPR
jgi:tetratricopeptide (TPR) repeat protein